MPNPLRVPYATTNTAGGEAGLLPYLPVTLNHQGRTVTAPGLVDTGATVNVLPYALGLELGAVWDDQAAPFQLSGNLAQFPARSRHRAVEILSDLWWQGRCRALI